MEENKEKTKKRVSSYGVKLTPNTDSEPTPKNEVKKTILPDPPDEGKGHDARRKAPLQRERNDSGRRNRHSRIRNAIPKGRAVLRYRPVFMRFWYAGRI